MVERFIRLLVEYDQKGQQIVREAQDQRREILDHMSDYKQEMSQQYRTRCDHRIDYYKAQAEAEKNEKLLEIRRSYAEQEQRLQEQFQRKSGEWVEQIVSHCIGG